MKIKLKPIQEQTIVITGASSGIGLVTARMAARQGACVVVSARSENALQRLVSEIESPGGKAAAVACDVANEGDVRRVAETAIARFGCIDTWVNNAGVSIFGNLLDISMEDQRRLFDVNFWGVVHGCRIALEHMRERGGALINVGSVVSDRAIPLQGIYSASKHAVKGYTEALRVELEQENAPVSVTLIKPTSINTPYLQHAKNYMDVEPTLPPPIYAPETVAEAILHCATHPERDMFVGGSAAVMSFSGRTAPRVTDFFMEKAMIRMERTDQPAGPREPNLFEGKGELAERGDYDGYVSERSLYTKGAMHPVMTSALLVGAGLAATALFRGSRK